MLSFGGAFHFSPERKRMRFGVGGRSEGRGIRAIVTSAEAQRENQGN